MLLIATERFLEKFFEKSFRNIWKFQKCVLSLHPLSPLKRRIAKKVLRKIFLKKVPEKFGSFKNSSYLCTAIFALSFERDYDDGSKKIRIWFFEDFEQLKFYLSRER